MWLFLIRVFTQLISFIRMTILMRLLMPSDFGLLGFASLTLSMITSLTEVGFREALIQKKDNVNDYLNVAWTTGLIRSVLIYLVIFFLAPFVAEFLDSDAPIDPRDVSNQEKLMTALVDNNNTFSVYVCHNISDAALNNIEEYVSSGEINDKFAENITSDLNKIASNGLLYQPERFENIKLSRYVLEIVSNPESVDNVFRANKLLIQQAYPTGIRITAIDKTQFILIVRVVSIFVLLAAFTNIGTVFFAKELDFHKRFYFQTISVVISVIVTIILAFIYRSVWALVFGKLIGNTVTVILSYIMHPYRPRFDFNLNKFKELWTYGKHLFATKLMTFACLHGDDLLLAKMLGATALGFYQKAFDAGNLVVLEIGSKIAEVGFPAYSKLQDNYEKVKAGYFKSLELVSLIVFPITAGLVMLAPEFVQLLFGEKWLEMVPVMRVFCLFGPFKCMQRGPVFMAIGRPDIIKKITFIRLIIIAITVYPFTKYFGMTGTAISVFLPILVCEPLNYYYMEKIIGAKAIQVVNRLIVPLVASILMSVFLAFRGMFIDNIGFLQVLILVGVSALIYSAVVIGARYVFKQYDAIALLKDIFKSL